jgi:hypothetical protein
MYLFIAGLSVLAATLGFLVGGSHSPVAGVAITAVFGLVLTAMGALQGSAVGKPSAMPEEPIVGAATGTKELRRAAVALERVTKQTYRRAGTALLTFAVLFLAGLLSGVYVRAQSSLEARSFPWDEAHKPQSAHDAVDCSLYKRTYSHAVYAAAGSRAVPYVANFFSRFAFWRSSLIGTLSRRSQAAGSRANDRREQATRTGASARFVGLFEREDRHQPFQGHNALILLTNVQC